MIVFKKSLLKRIVSHILAWVALCIVSIDGNAQEKPNIIFFLLDDLGVKDLACYGSSFHETPNLDKLANQGARFTNAYASHPVCGPSRTAIMSGRLPARMGVTTVGGRIQAAGTPWPKVLQEAGYTTYFTGKWHMGNEETVLSSGFDVNIGGHKMGMPFSFYYPYADDKPNARNVPHMADGKEGDYLTDKLTEKALNFMEQNREKPFLLYMSYYQTHHPLKMIAQGKKEDVAYFEEKLKTMPELEGPKTRTVSHGESKATESLVQRHPEFAAQVKAVDDNVGRIMQKVDELGIADNTVIIFTSDQGSVSTNNKMVSSQKPYRLGKAFLFEGGIRVPFIVRWPGKIKEMSIKKTVTVNTDIYPTILELAGLSAMPEQHQDGVSIKSVLTGDDQPFDRSIHWVFDSAHSLGHKPSVAVRKGDYKLIYWINNGHKELYNVVSDIGENKDLSQLKPEVLDAMLKELKQPEFMAQYLVPKEKIKKGKKGKKKKK